jgi:hypothetical protein
MLKNIIYKIEQIYTIIFKNNKMILNNCYKNNNMFQLTND